MRIDHPDIARLVAGRANVSALEQDYQVKAPGFVEIWPREDAQLAEEHLTDILAGLSFFFGRSLGLHGISRHNELGEVLSVKATSEFLRSGFTDCRPPAYLKWDDHPMFDPERVANAMSAYLNYPEIELLRNALWRLEFGRASIYELSGVYYGGALEILETAYKRVHTQRDGQEEICTQRIGEEKFVMLKNKLFKVIDDFRAEADALEKRVAEDLKSVIGKGNEVPKREFRSRMFDHLGLACDAKERLAIETRNMAAHGELLPNCDRFQWFEGNTALRTLVNRIVLAMLDLNVDYFDYCSPPGPRGYPVRALSSPQGRNFSTLSDA